MQFQQQTRRVRIRFVGAGKGKCADCPPRADTNVDLVLPDRQAIKRVGLILDLMLITRKSRCKVPIALFFSVNGEFIDAECRSADPCLFGLFRKDQTLPKEQRHRRTFLWNRHGCVGDPFCAPRSGKPPRVKGCCTGRCFPETIRCRDRDRIGGKGQKRLARIANPDLFPVAAHTAVPNDRFGRRDCDVIGIQGARLSIGFQ